MATERIFNLDQLTTGISDWSIPVSKTGESVDKRILVSQVLQSLSYDPSTKELTLSDGGTVDLSNISIPDYDLFGGEIDYASSTSYTVQPFSCLDDTGTYVIELDSVYTKTTGSWSVGSGAVGSLDTGTFEANKQYYIWAIYRDDTGVSDILLSLSNSGPSLPIGYTHKKLIGSIKSLFANTLFDEKSTLNYHFYKQYGGNGYPYPDNYVNDFSFDVSGTDISPVKINDNSTGSDILCRAFSNNCNIQLRDEIIKTTSTFAAGSGNGAFDTTTPIDISTYYYIYAISKANGIDPDIYISENSITSVALPSGYTEKQLIGYCNTNDSAQISNIRGVSETENTTNITNVTTATYTVQEEDEIIQVNYAGTVTITIPEVLTYKVGFQIVIKDISGSASSNNITIESVGSGLFDGESDAVINGDYGFFDLYCDGNNFYTK